MVALCFFFHSGYHQQDIPTSEVNSLNDKMYSHWQEEEYNLLWKWYMYIKHWQIESQLHWYMYKSIRHDLFDESAMSISLTHLFLQEYIYMIINISKIFI